MPTTTSNTGNTRNNRRRAGGFDGASGLETYFSDLDREALMDAEQERAIAERIARLRREYWLALLGYPPFLEAIVRSVSEHAAQRDRKLVSLRKMTAAAPVLRGRPRKAAKAKAESALRSFARELAEIDRSLEFADRIYADLETIEAGNADQASLGVRSPASGSAPFAEYLHRVKASRFSLCAARQQMVRANLRLVVTMAQRYRRNGRLPLADLVQEGNLGLMTAVDRFDPSKGFRFSTYGSWWIRHAIGRALSDKGRAVRLPVHVVELQHKIARAKREFEAKHRRPPQTDELAEAVGVPAARLERLERSLLIRDTSLDRPDREGGVRGIEVIADEGPTADHLLHDSRLEDVLEDAFDELRPMEVDILRHRFGLDGAETMTLREVGQVHGLSRERIRQLQERALEKIRERLVEAGFEAGLKS